MSNFTHLHLHTQFSLLDGACRINQLLDKAVELGQTSVAITDHGAMYGVVDFYKAAKQRGIKPIIGCEVYLAARTRFDKVHSLDSERAHLVLLCKNNEGYKNLIAMVSEAWTSGFYTKARIDRELLEKHHEGLIALSACLAGEIPKLIMQNDYEGAKSKALWYNNLFGSGNFYLEMQDHGLDGQAQVNDGIIRISKETGIPLVATNDTHYIEQSDAKIQQILICIQTNHTLGEETGLEFSTDQFYLKSEDEMRELFPNNPEAINNTQVIADKCNVEFEFGNIKLPYFQAPDGIDNFVWFKQECYKGLNNHFGDNVPQEYLSRLEFELNVINDMGYVDYFLIVHDFIRYAKSKGIPVGPGRGSGAGSLAAYAIGITGVDPIKYNLLFERFLNPERVSMPDFDIDFCYVRRQEVIDYVIEKYGFDHVAQIITFGTLAAKAAVRDVGRAMGISYAVVDNVAKQIPFEYNSIDKALEHSPAFKTLYDNNDEVHELIDNARKVEGMPRHASTHAAGVVITRDPVAEYVPLAKNDEAVVTQFTMTTLEELGLLKMDFLGLRTLTVISDSEKMVKKHTPDFDIEKIDMEDLPTFEMFSRGQTLGIFQFESGWIKKVLAQMNPRNIEDLTACTSLCRPGPMDSIPRYLKNRQAPDKIKYKTPLLEGILGVTYGCMVYQEQVMEIFRTLAGYSLGRADIVRRAMSKKKHDVMERERHNFIYGLKNDDGTVECVGAVYNGVDEKSANEIFDDMSSFASYAFNKSHAAAYAVVAYETAWLKCHYPAEFMAALLSSVLESASKVSEYINECTKLDIKVLPPNVNYSDSAFTISEKSIRFGMLAIKNLGKNFIRAIINERNTMGSFKSFPSFCKRMYGKDFNRRAIEGLIFSGALDNLGANRRQMMEALPEIISNLENEKRRNVEGQIGFFDMGASNNDYSDEFSLPQVSEYPSDHLLRMEKEITGLYLSGHPMNAYRELGIKQGCAKTVDLRGEDIITRYKDGDKVHLICIISSVKKKITKSNATMAYLSVEDIYGDIDAIVFPKTYDSFFHLLKEGKIVTIYGHLSIREDEAPKIVCSAVKPVEETQTVNSTESANQTKNLRKGVFLRFDSKDSDKIEKCEKFLNIFDGRDPLFYYYLDTKKYIKQPSYKFIDANEPLINELKNILGEENVFWSK